MTKVLIVEDDPYVRDLYKMVFAKANYEVMLAENGEEGLEKAQTSLPDIILLDVMLPKLDGLQVLQKLKNDPKTNKITVVMLTNLGDGKIVNIANKFGADGFLVKAQVEALTLPEEVRKYMKKPQI